MKLLASPNRPSSRVRRYALTAFALAAALLCAPLAAQAQYQLQVGPRNLYPRFGVQTNHTATPLAMRDAIQSIAIGTRLLEVKPRIMGGEQAPFGAYPWVASIGLKGTNQRDGHFCGGAFIAPNWVMTAAHCVNSESAPKIQVFGGSNELEQGGTVYLVDRIVVHEQYDDGTQDFDVALLHLAKPFTGRTLNLVTATDADRMTSVGTLVTAIGWGLTAEGTQVSNVLRRVTVQVFSNKTCNGVASYAGTVTDRMMCAGFPEGGKDSCQGDSGGPLVATDAAGNYFQAGVVSWGEGCGRPNKFGVYTRVSTIQSWVADRLAGKAQPPRAKPQTAPAPGVANTQMPGPARSAAAPGSPQLQLGPRSLYPRSAAAPSDTPIVMRDALQFLQSRQRLLALKPRIMGGEPSPPGAYPWTASIELKGSKPRDGHFCGGSFIAADWVLTAAHCVKTETASKIQVYGGNNNLDGGGAVHAVDRVIVHEKYDDGTQENDVALIHLSTPYTGKTLRMITAAEAGRLAPAGTSAIVVGWGYTEEGGDVQNTQRRVTVQLLSNEACNAAAAYGGSITSGMLCAGFAAGGKDSCQGDSGGPLSVDDGTGGRVQVGIVSWGEGCGKPNRPGVYTRVSTVQAWVADKIGGRAVSTAPARNAPPAAGTTPRLRNGIAEKGVASNSRAQALPPLTVKRWIDGIWR
jgi:transmembrane serine protease 9